MKTKKDNTVRIRFNLSDVITKLGMKLVDEKIDDVKSAIYALKRCFNEIGAPYIMPAKYIVLEGYPLGAISASGRFRDYVFCAPKKRRNYVRRYVKPKKPNSDRWRQSVTRFRLAAHSWHTISPQKKAYYNRLAESQPKPMSGYNVYMREKLKF